MHLAPTQSEPPFLIAQVVLLAIVALLVIVAALRFRPLALRLCERRARWRLDLLGQLSPSDRP